ncbi:MAG: hypothetical protein CMP11_09110 [Zetaproteobacteria bacterium]|nr:hypothetical protein [Pseudobdellovibrionaceae bacterium]
MSVKKITRNFFLSLYTLCIISCSVENDDEVATKEQEETLVDHKLLFQKDVTQDTFNLLTDASSIIIDIEGCTSGYRQTGLLIGATGGTFQLRKSDQNCEVFIRSFVADNHVYLAPLDKLGEDNTGSWDTADDEVTFHENNGQSLAIVKVGTPLATNVDGGTVAFTFRTFDQGTSAVNTFNQGTNITLTGTDVPNFKILEGADLVISDINADGKATFDVVFECQGAWVDNDGDTSTCDTIAISNFSAQILDASSDKDFATFDNANLDATWVNVADDADVANSMSVTLPAVNAPLENNLLMLVVLRYVDGTNKAYRWYYLQALPMSN